jgi:hypothetical protein
MAPEFSCHWIGLREITELAMTFKLRRAYSRIPSMISRCCTMVLPLAPWAPWAALAHLVLGASIAGAAPAPILKNVFPAGGQIGTSSAVNVSGDNLDGLSALRWSHPGITFQHEKENRFTVTTSADTPAGLYDVQAVCAGGLSSTRTFFVTARTHILEHESDDGAGEAQQPQQVTMDAVISGRIEKNGDVDQYRFTAKRGQQVVLECWAARIDSSLRAVLELSDTNGKRLAAQRHSIGIDPVIHFSVPADGEYVVRLVDRVYSGSADHFYRLDIGVGPRVLFAVPSVMRKESDAELTLYGWNLDDEGGDGGTPTEYDSVRLRVKAPDAASSIPVYRRPAESVVDGFAHHFPGADMPIRMSLTDVPVVLDRSDNHSANRAQPIEIPCEVSGTLVRGNERDWYAIDAKRGEVFHLETFGQRIGSPVDLDVSVLDETGNRGLIAFHDEISNVGGLRFPSNHLDAAGRWVAPADGRFLIVVRNLIGELADDPRRVYRLSVRREEPDAGFVAVAHQPATPAGINLRRGGRAVVDVLAFRRRGLSGSVRVSARNLPPGVACPDIWLGPGVTCAPLVLTAEERAEPLVGSLDLLGHFDLAGIELQRRVQGGTMVRTDVPNGSGRLTGDVPWSIGGEASLRITADGFEKRDHHLYGELEARHFPGGMLDVAIQVKRRESGHSAPVKLTGVGLPDLIENQSATIPVGQAKGYISFYLPPALPVGRYTIVIAAETTVPLADDKKTPAPGTAFSNAVTFEVHRPAFRVEVDRQAPRRIKRGETLTVNYSVRRMNGFIGKIHTELAIPGSVTNVGDLRGRGVTSVGQTETGTIQIVANEDARLGQTPFLRLYAVGVVEDEPAFQGSCFLELEIVEGE